MSKPRTVAVIVEWQAVDSPWVDHRWRVTEILPDPAPTPPWTLLQQTPRLRRYLAGNTDLSLFPLETDTLKVNVEGPDPAIYVFLRHTAAPPGLELHGATVCVGEAGAHADTGSDIVEAVPMPPAITAWVQDYLARHHVERPTFKRKRDRWADPVTEPVDD